MTRPFRTDRFLVNRRAALVLLLGASSTMALPARVAASKRKLASYIGAGLVPGSVVLPPLGPSVASFMAGQSAGTLIAAITGLAPGETVTGVTPNDGRLATASAGIVIGLTAPSAGTIAAIVTTSLGRTLAMTITVAPKLAITGTPLQATVGTAYTFTPTITGGFAPYTLTSAALLTGTQITESPSNAPKVYGTPTEAQTGLSADITVTDSRGNSATIQRSFTSVAPSSLTIEPVGRLTRSGVKVAQLTPATAGTAPTLSGTNANHFAVDANGAVTTTTTGTNAGFQAADYNFSITGAQITTTLIIPTEAGAYDVSDGTTLGASVTAALAVSNSGEYLCRPRNGTIILATSAGGGFAIQGKVFQGNINDVNRGKVDGAQIDYAASASFSGGSFLIKPRTPLSAKVVGAQSTTTGRGLVLYGSSGFQVEDMVIENVAGADSYDRNIQSTDRDVTAVSGTSCLYVRVDNSNPTYGKHIFKRCVIGAPDSAPYTRYPYGVDIDQASEVILEDCIIKNTYNGIRNQTCAFLSVRRCEIKNFLVDALNGYPNNPGTSVPAPTFTECFFAESDNVIHSPNLGSEFAGAHCDGRQIGDAGATLQWRLSSHYNIFAMDADQTLKETQGGLLKDTPTGIFIRGRESNNVYVNSTLNGMILSRMDPNDRYILEKATMLRSTKFPPKSGNGGPFRITVEKGNGGDQTIHGPRIVNCIFGEFKDTSVSSTGPWFVADPVPGGFGTRTLQGGGTVEFDNNCYLSHLTKNTGAGDSYPENFAGMAGAAYLDDRGTQFSIDYTSAATIRASVKALVAIKAGSPAVGKGATVH